MSSKQEMIDVQLNGRGIHDRRVLDAMSQVDREDFVPEHLREMAYEDNPLPLEGGQTISQPYIVAFMLEAADLKPGDHVLDVGTGCGYAAAVTSRLVSQVFSVEVVPSLYETAKKRLKHLGYENIEVRLGDGKEAFRDRAPFDAILVAAASKGIPSEFMNQLKMGGNLIIPVERDDLHQVLTKIERVSEEEFKKSELMPVRFVSLQ